MGVLNFLFLKGKMMADDISVNDMVKRTVQAIEEFASEVDQDMSDIQILMTDKEIRNQWMVQQIRLNHCKDLEGKLTTGGEPITSAQIEQCIAFATGDFERLRQPIENKRNQDLSQ